MARSLAGDAVKRKLLKVGIIAEEEEYAGLVSKAFEAEFRRQGGEVTLAENVPVNSDSLRTVLTKVLSQKVDFIFFSSAYQAGTFLKQLRVLNENVPVYGNDTMCVSDTIDAAGAAAERVRCANVLLDESKAMAANFRKALEKKYGAAPTSLFYASLGHDAFYLMQQELRNGESAGKLLLGAGRRGEDGIYYVEPKVLEIRSGKMLPVESLK
jgi:ABC-type branched-subunit amino acid transport system substrate-binding protein